MTGCKNRRRKIGLKKAKRDRKEKDAKTLYPNPKVGNLP